MTFPNPQTHYLFMGYGLLDEPPAKKPVNNTPHSPTSTPPSPPPKPPTQFHGED